MAVVAELLRSHMPADQSDWLDLAQTLGQGKLRERAARMDEENRFPFENYDDLIQATNPKGSGFNLCDHAHRQTLYINFESFYFEGR